MGVFMKNIIFDVDRTLVDSYGPELSTLNEALYLATGKLYSDEVMNQLTVLTTDEFFQSLDIHNQDTLKKVNHYWGELLKKQPVVMFPDIPEMLTFLSEQNKFLGIVTSRTYEELEEISDLMKILPIFSSVITSDLVKQPKPNPESILTILERFQLDPKETVYVGDSKVDMLAAKSAGVLFAYASWDNYDDTITYDFLLSTPDDLKNLIGFSNTKILTEFSITKVGSA